MIKRLLNEAINQYINEISWEKDFADVQKECLSPEELKSYLNKVISNANKGYGEREKFSPKMPFIHSKSKLFKGGKLDIQDFTKRITEKPNSLINTNEKMLKSGQPNEYFYKTGVPAFRGIAYDISKNRFYVINTCPGAGECRVICYALKGRYIQYPNSYDLMTRRLNYLLNYPNEYENQLYVELKQICAKHKALKGYESKIILRWNDSGDFFTKKYVSIAERVIKRLQEEGFNIIDDAYTKMADVAKSSNIGSVAFSLGGSKKERSKIDTDKQKISVWVPTELFKGLDLAKISDKQLLKQKVAEYFNLPLKDIITYAELLKTPENPKLMKWHVLVTPNDGDDAAARKDVKTILLTQH